MKGTTLTILLALYGVGMVPAQNIGVTEIDPATLRPWVEKDPSAYQGVYHFGENDGSHLVLLVQDTMIVAQIREGYWEEGTGIFKMGFTTLANVRIDSGAFFSDRYSGTFVTYTAREDRQDYPSLRIDHTWTSYIDRDRYEVGVRMDAGSFKEEFPGEYPQASTRCLREEELSGLTLGQLSIMRNEIYARYAFKFQKGGELERHFKAQGWYYPKHEDVSSFITAIELRNLALLKREEARR